MKSLKKANDVLNLLAKNQIKEHHSVQLSDYVYTYPKKDAFLLFQTLTLEIIELTHEEYQHVQNNSFIHMDCYSYLVDHHFLVDAALDEYKKYRNLKQICRFIRQKTKGNGSYVILPTTACNARCFYCFEDFHQTYTFTKEQCDQVIDYILKTKHEGPIKIRWFGGEPMLGERNINIICQALKDHDVSFTSMMVSNGSLFTEEKINIAVREWNLNKIQLTLDGLRDTYHQRKNYYYSEMDYFTKIVDNINIFIDNDVSVQIRLNVDWDNIDEMEDLVDLLSKKVINKSKCRIYSYPLFSMYDDKKIIPFLERCFAIDRYVHEKGFPMSETMNLSKFKTNFCCADSSQNVVINATGELFKCEDCIPSTGVGNIIDGITDMQKYNDYINPAQPQPCCCHCQFLPLCTDIPYCPHNPKYPVCMDIMKLRVMNTLKNLGYIPD